MAIKFMLTEEQKAANIAKSRETRAKRLQEKYGGMLARYREGRMYSLSNAAAGKILGVSASTVTRMLQWQHTTKYGELVKARAADAEVNA